jgi:DNA polymerase I
VLLSVLCSDYKIEDDIHPSIFLFCRDANKNKYLIKDTTFEPYFYVDAKGFENSYRDLPKELIGLIKRVDKTDKYYQNELVKIITKLPSDIKKLREFYENKRNMGYFKGIPTCEGDIVYSNRFLIDKGITSGIEVNDNYFRANKDLEYIPWSDRYMKPSKCDFSNYRLVFVDIETKGNTPKDNSATVPVTVIGFYDNYIKEYVIFYNRDEPSSYRSKNIFHFKLEKEMIQAFINYVNKNQPDIISSFTTFDLFYLLKRIDTVGLNKFRLSPMECVTNFKEEHIKISGIHYVDLREIYRTVVGGQKFENLESISLKVLGYGKQPLSKGDILNTWLYDYKNVLYYNLRDVLLIKNIDKKLDLVEYLDTIRKIAGIKYNDCLYAARIADTMYLRVTHDLPVALPTRTVFPIKSYSGGQVFTAKRGKHHYVLCLDFKSLYPNIIRSFNIGTNSYDPYGDILVAIENGIEYRFNSKEKSWAVSILDLLNPLLVENSALSDKAKEEKNFAEMDRLKRRRMGIKSVVNGIYGFFGYGGNWEEHTKAARLYNPTVAESITIASRAIITEVANAVERMGYTLVAGDTDSIFVKIDCNNEEDFKKQSEAFHSKIQLEMHNIIFEKWHIDPKNFSLEIDAYYKRFIIFAKKRYCGLPLVGDINTKV